MRYCLYLRKSRKDIEAEKHGDIETLARHEKMLLELAKRLNLNITEIYREVVSGETIAARPIMQRLLQEVEQGVWSGVLVMEVERLARGDTIDQGIVAQTFKYSNTKIITPTKTYNPNNEFDEEYFEFGLFMSRREYKTINRRLQRGRIASVKEGKYIANSPPYGYERVRIQNDKGFTLAPIEEEAETIRLIFELYTIGERQPDGSRKRLGTGLIARRLNTLKIPTRKGGSWVVSTVRDILINPVYIGKVRWNWRHNVKKIVDGSVSVSRPRSNSDECMIVNGLHPPIISKETFDLAQELMSSNPPRPIGKHNTVKNPLGGIVVCGKCGHKMVRRPYKGNYPDTLICAYPTCDNVSSVLYIVEERILSSLEEWLNEYKLKWNPNNLNKSEKAPQPELKQKALKHKKTELDKLKKQLSKAHDLLEQGVYNTNTFLERSQALTERISTITSDISMLEKELQNETAYKKNSLTVIPKTEKLLEVYDILPTAKEKNDMLKEVLEKVVYVKEHPTRQHGSPNDFKIVIYPKIPKNDN